MIGPALLALALAAGATQEASDAFRAGRYQEAVALLERVEPPDYDALLLLGLAHGRLGHSAEAGAAFDRAIALQPERPEAWVERGGLRFLARRYAEAVRDLERALALKEDAYARDLLASSLYLAGRSDEAIACWNRLGQPRVRRLSITGLVHTRDRVVRRELSLSEGERLGLASLRASRRRLQEVGIFDRVTLRPIPRGEGEADLEVALTEQHGFAHGAADFLVTIGLNAVYQRFRLRYANLAGTGLSLGGSLRWRENRPETTLFLQSPRPFGIPAYLQLRGFRDRQSFDLDGGFRVRRRGIDVGARHVFPGGAVGHLGLRLRQRSVSAPRPDTPPGAVVGVEARMEQRLVESHRQRLEAVLGAFGALRWLGSDLGYVQLAADLGYQAMLGPAEGLAIERSVVAARLRGGWGSAGLPTDEMYAPGFTPELELPLRAHPLTREGILGVNPIGRSVVLLNLEWRRRVWARPGAQLGMAWLYDAAWVGRPAGGSHQGALHDVGVGLRLALVGAPLIRLDLAHGLTDGRNAVTIGLSQAF